MRTEYYNELLVVRLSQACSAVPEMLEALRVGLNLTLDESDPAHAHFIRLAKSALAKATTPTPDGTGKE